MDYNESLFNCSLYTNKYVENPCTLKLGYIESIIFIYALIAISSLSIILNVIFLFFNFIKKKRTQPHKALIHRIFLIFPFTDLFTSTYWLLSSIKLYDLESIKENITLCSLISVFYLFLITFQFILINIILFHFRKINKNPLEAIFNPKRKLILYLIICFLLSFISTGLAVYFQLIGISPINSCFISIKGGLKNLIFLIPLICITIAIIQLIHDLFFIYMFTSDKSIRNIYKKNLYYFLIFCLLHIPLIIIMIFSVIIGKNYFETKRNLFVEYFIIFTTIITCIIPFLMSILRQIQGLTRFECINNCIKKRNLEKVRRTIENYKNYKNENIKENISIDLDPYEWLENHIMENFIRDILLGVAVSIKNSKKYDDGIISDLSLKNEDFEESKKYKINFKNFKKFGINDFTVEKSDYLNIQVIDYAPKCFYYLRKLENIDIDIMVESFLPGNNSKRIKESLGKSGSFFISTDDNRYMIKTLKSQELELLKHAFLKEYVKHIEQNPKSLLCRLYGMYNIILGQGDEILIIVMRNVIGDFKNNTIVKFDLKGSTYKRKANFQMENSNYVMKDLDFIEFEKSIMMSKQSIQRLREITEADSNFLKKSGLMDYSLFLVKLTLQIEEEEDVFGENIRERQNNDFKQFFNEKNNKNEKIMDWGRASYRGVGVVHDVENYRQYLYPSLNHGTAYIISIIDYFQIFNFFKYMESSIKNNLHRKNTISCVDPITYSKRFIKYIYMLTDVEQFLSNEIEEIKVEDTNEEYSEDNDDEENNFLKRYKKKQEILEASSLSQSQNQLLIQNE